MYISTIMKYTWIAVLLLGLNLKISYCNLLFGPCPRPPNFPVNIRFRIHRYESFDRQIKVPFAYIVTPRSEDEVVTLSNWAFQNGFRVRPMGSSHSWAPFQFALSDSGVPCPNTILVDTTRYFTSKTLNPTDYGRPDLHSVTVGAGLKLRQLLEFLEEHDLGLFASPSVGDLTVGGMLAIGAHGSGIPSKFDQKSPGHSYGTISNLVIDMTIVAWNKKTSSYHMKTLYRWDKDCKAFLTSLGRTFITSVTLRVGKNQNLWSQSHFFIPANELFADPDVATDSTRTIAKFADEYGRINPVALPAANLMWVITWKAEALKPPNSRLVLGPFNYYFMNYFPGMLDPVLREFLKTVPSFSKLIGIFGYPFIFTGTLLSGSLDYWGASKNHLLYFSSFVPRMTPNSLTVVTSRANLQLVVSIIKSHYDRLSKEYAKQHLYPNPTDFNLRITGVDNPEEIEIPGAESPSLSAGSLLPEYPDYDVVIWIETDGYPDTLKMQEFHSRLQSHILKEIHGRYGIMRVEWPKAWAFTTSGPWKNTTVMSRIFPRSFSTSDNMEEWNWAVKTLDSYDPHRIFSNKFLDNLLVVY